MCFVNNYDQAGRNAPKHVAYSLYLGNEQLPWPDLPVRQELEAAALGAPTSLFCSQKVRELPRSSVSSLLQLLLWPTVYAR